MKRLVIFSSNYPNPNGDAPFVSNEIATLAAGFDETIVFHTAAAQSDQLSLPQGVTSVHSLAVSRADLIRSLFTLGSWRGLAACWRSDWRKLRSVAIVREFVRATLTGRAMSLNPALKSALAAEGVTVYHFWGMGSALITPWIQQDNLHVRLHGFDLYERRGYLPLRVALFERVKTLLVVSRVGLEHITEKYPETRPKAVVSHLGSRDRGAAVTASPADITVVSCSNLIPLKRVDEIARAMVILAGDSPVRWVHFGAGEEMPAVESAVQNAPDTLTVELRGYQPNDSVLDFLKNQPVTCIAMMSSSEGIPVSLMEAISFGIPIVSTSVGGIPELFDTDTDMGELLDEAASAKDLANAIDAVHNRDIDRDMIRSFWDQNFNAVKNAQFTLRQLLNAKPATERK